jgi:hypothetical protein
MVARDHLGEIPMRRIGVYAAWKFKKPRFNHLARELGIIRRFYFHGLATTDEAEAGKLARQGEVSQVEEIRAINDHLLLSHKWEGKRAKRYAKDLNCYKHRLGDLKTRFGDFFDACDSIREYGIGKEKLQKAFKDSVIM